MNKVNNTENEVNINNITQSGNSSFFKNFLNKSRKFAQNVKKCVNTIKEDFIDDMKEHYNYVTTTYNQISQNRSYIVE